MQNSESMNNNNESHYTCDCMMGYWSSDESTPFRTVQASKLYKVVLQVYEMYLVFTLEQCGRFCLLEPDNSNWFRY